MIANYTATQTFEIISKSTLMEFRHHHNGVYEFLFFKSCAQALDEWFVEIEKFYKQPQGTQIRILVNTTLCHDQPLIYAFRKASQLIPRYPNRPNPMYYAYVGSNMASPMRKFLQDFIRRLNSGDKTTYLYGAEKYQEAMAWLLLWPQETTDK